MTTHNICLAAFPFRARARARGLVRLRGGFSSILSFALCLLTQSNNSAVVYWQKQNHIASFVFGLLAIGKYQIASPVDQTTGLANRQTAVVI